MEKPTTLLDALNLVRKSRLVADDQLEAYLERVGSAWRLDAGPDELFGHMVHQGLLTSFQAQQLGHGRWKGFELGNYRILDRLGEGGMGQVFLAEHRTLGKRVALKLLNRRTVSPLARERFLREARAAAKLNHPNIIHVHDINPEHDPPFIVMEYADGVTLQAAVARGGPLAPGVAALVGCQIAAGLDAASRHGLVHRDIKPANILIDRHGIARILDMGIVRVEGENLTGEYAQNVILGTIDFFSPEQALNSSDVDIRADIYSLGATLYFALTGVSPLPGGPFRERMHRLQTEEPLSVHVLRPDVPGDLAAIIHRMLAKLPKNRYQTPAEAADALAPFVKVDPPYPAQLFVRVTTSEVDRVDGSAAAAGVANPLTATGGTPTAEMDCSGPKSDTNIHHVAGLVRGLCTTEVLCDPANESPLRNRRAAGLPLRILLVLGVIAIAALAGMIRIAFYGSN